MLWAIARWRLDGPRFFEVLLGYDFIARTRGALEGHEGSPIYYVQILAKHHYDWLLAALAAVVLFPMPWQRIRTAFTRDANIRDVVLIAWMANVVLIPTAMPTKLPWYLNSFYPVFALAIAWLVISCLTIAATTTNYHRRGAALAVIVATMLGVAETKLHWYSFHYRDLRRSTQGLILSERQRLEGRRVFCSRFYRGEAFVLGSLLRTNRQLTEDLGEFLRSCGVHTVKGKIGYRLRGHAITDPRADRQSACLREAPRFCRVGDHGPGLGPRGRAGFAVRTDRKDPYGTHATSDIRLARRQVHRGQQPDGKHDVGDRPDRDERDRPPSGGEAAARHHLVA